MKNNNQFSKECIATALIELMKTKDYSSITITEIAKKSGMSRMTYYRNYSSKDDILVQYINSVGEQIQDLVIKRNSPYDTETYFTILFESFGINSDNAVYVPVRSAHHFGIAGCDRNGMV